jgi:hypothetical protein
MLVKKLKLKNSKNVEKPIYKYLFVDANNQAIQLTCFGIATYDKYVEGNVLSLTSFMVCSETKNAFWFKSNTANLYLLSNSISRIKHLNEIPSFKKDFLHINELDSLDIQEKYLISVQCVLININSRQIGEKTNLKALAIDCNKNVSIDLNIWGDEVNLINNFVYNLSNLMVEPSQGYVLSKIWCSSYEQVTQHECKHYDMASCLNITTKTIIGVKFESWAELEAATESVGSISVMLMDVKLYQSSNKLSSSISFKFQDLNNKIATATAWSSSALEPVSIGIKLADAEENFQALIGESFKIKVSIKRKRSMEEGTRAYYSLLKIQK